MAGVGKSLADWLDSDSDDSPVKPLRRKSSGAYAAVFDTSTTNNNSAHRHQRSTHSRNSSRNRSPNLSEEEHQHHRYDIRRSSSRNSLHRSSSRGSIVGTIRGVGIMTPPTDPPLPQLDTAKAKRQQEADERKRRMEEMKAKLRETLGDAAADKIAAKGGNPADAIKPSRDDDEGGGGAGGGGAGPNSLPSHLPPLSARSSMDFNRRASNLNHHHGSPHSHANNGGGYNQFASTPPRHVVVETEVMLADRGTQTACEVEVQTDPDPLVASCPQCYKETYGHVHHNFFNCGHSGAPAVQMAAAMGIGGGGMMGDPVFAKLMASRLGGPGSMVTAGGGYGASPLMPHSHGGGHGGYPQQQHQAHMMMGGAGYGGLRVGGAAMTSSGSSSDQWRDQLNYIESSIDMLIKRYNLPPPPGMERYAPRM